MVSENGKAVLLKHSCSIAGEKLQQTDGIGCNPDFYLTESLLQSLFEVPKEGVGISRSFCINHKAQ